MLVQGAWATRKTSTFYEEERYDRLLPTQEERERKRAIKALERLGYSVTLDKVA